MAEALRAAGAERILDSVAQDALTKRLRALDAARQASVVEDQRRARESLRLRVGTGAVVDPFAGVTTTLKQLSRPAIYDATEATRRMATMPRIGLLDQPSALERLIKPIDYDALTRSPVRDAMRRIERPRFFDVFEQMDRRQWMMNRFVGPVTFEPELRPRIAPVHAIPSSDVVMSEVRLTVEEYLERRSPTALRRLDGARAAIARGDEESLAQGATSCRRTLEAIADAVFPPVEGVSIPNLAGKFLRVGAMQYRNRLALFLEERVASKSGRAHDLAMLDHLVAQVAPLVKGSSKGVHDEVALGEVQRLYLSTINLLAEIARHDA